MHFCPKHYEVHMTRHMTRHLSCHLILYLHSIRDAEPGFQGGCH